MFEAVPLTWKGETYTVRPKNVMGLIYSIEQHVTLAKLCDRQNLSMVELSRAYQAALTYAGVEDVEPSDVYCELFELEAGENIQNVIDKLYLTLVPPSSIKNTTGNEASAMEKKSKPAPAKKGSSKKPT